MPCHDLTQSISTQLLGSTISAAAACSAVGPGTANRLRVRAARPASSGMAMSGSAVAGDAAPGPAEAGDAPADRPSAGMVGAGMGTGRPGARWPGGCEVLAGPRSSRHDAYPTPVHGAPSTITTSNSPGPRLGVRQ